MEHSVEDVSPVKKKIKIQATPEEVNAAIQATAALYKDNTQMDGYRKGKVPQGLIEKRFHDAIIRDARDDLVNVHINEILQSLNVEPVGPLHLSGVEIPLEKNKPFEYEMEIEVAPQFELPNYEGLEATEEKVAPSDALVDLMLKRMQEERSSLVPVDTNEPAHEGQIANIDFETILDGKAVKDFQTSGFDLEIGKKSALPEFEEFVKTIPVGHTAEKEITFPEDFIAKELAGKTPLMKVTVHAVKERKLPELDDKFAEMAGKENLASLRQELADSYAKTMQQMHKGATQKKLLDQLVKQTDFPLPENMIEAESNLLIGDILTRAEKEGRRVSTEGGDLDKLKATVRKQAEENARNKLFLMAVAKKENLEVPLQDVEKEVLMGAYRMGIDPVKYFEKMRETGMIFQLRDNMLCDKAMDLIYERANITFAEPESKDDSVVAEEES